MPNDYGALFLSGISGFLKGMAQKKMLDEQKKAAAELADYERQQKEKKAELEILTRLAAIPQYQAGVTKVLREKYGIDIPEPPQPSVAQQGLQMFGKMPASTQQMLLKYLGIVEPEPPAPDVQARAEYWRWKAEQEKQKAQSGGGGTGGNTGGAGTGDVTQMSTDDLINLVKDLRPVVQDMLLVDESGNPVQLDYTQLPAPIRHSALLYKYALAELNRRLSGGQQPASRQPEKTGGKTGKKKIQWVK